MVYQQTVTDLGAKVPVIHKFTNSVTLPPETLKLFAVCLIKNSIVSFGKKVAEL